ncbi:MgtC/SapB family protein [Ramlibacter rhizophilus]|uniref:Protein MgtC n=1 Tax=Ramlibacter rhizophilus TaxID=1781167 RepID=A0A4Z0BJR3_9BURK|nr:MgtC/SapB family protein [Ramlibacter rhizophilus]TFY99555.1 MgtC/SapB family protein [Ramlibacter rhizophilus]
MDTWGRVLDTIAAEFSDLREIEDLTRVLVRLGVAAVLGALLGFERERAHKAAGLRTHILVSMGAALFVLMAVRSNFDPEPLSRVIQGVAAGIGFLCAGAILKSESSEQVRGLTTSAGLWMTTAIGLTAGLGHELLAVVGALLALVVLRLEGPVQRWLGGGSPGERGD